MVNFRLITIKRIVEEVIMFPFILAGKLIAKLNPLRQEYDFFIFFPSYCLGGAEKVNGEIIEALSDQKIIIFFTRTSKDDLLRHLFVRPNITIKEINRWTDNKFIYPSNFIYRGICAYYINKQKKLPVVFNGQCNFAYKLFPHVKKTILKVELIHNSNLQFAKVTFPYIPFIDKRIMITDSIVRTHKEYYSEIGVPEEYERRITKIINCVNVPDFIPKKRGDKIKAYYAGRGGYQKRLKVLFEVVRRSINDGLPIDFYFAGTFEEEIPQDLKSKIHWLGGISDEVEMYKLHQAMDVLLMTSRFEGFPMSIMEAMACGVAIISTAVDGIPEHVKDGKNGYLIKENKDEALIVSLSLAALKKIADNHNLLDAFSSNNHGYAIANFSKEIFWRSYREAFLLKN